MHRCVLSTMSTKDADNLKVSFRINSPYSEWIRRDSERRKLSAGKIVQDLVRAHYEKQELRDLQEELKGLRADVKHVRSFLDTYEVIVEE